MFSIYALGDPRTQQIRYIGKAKNVYTRFAQHLNAPHHNQSKDAWMDDIKAAGIAPTLAILETNIDASIISDREKYWIEHYLALGAPLTNIAHGPRGSTEVLTDYISAQDAALILGQKRGSPVRADYVSKMANGKKHRIRVVRLRGRWLYHRDDIAACSVLALDAH